MSDTELTVSHPLQVKVDLRGLDFNGLVEAIAEAAAGACGELLGQALRAVEGAARGRGPPGPNLSDTVGKMPCYGGNRRS